MTMIFGLHRILRFAQAMWCPIEIIFLNLITDSGGYLQKTHTNTKSSWRILEGGADHFPMVIMLASYMEFPFQW